MTAPEEPAVTEPSRPQTSRALPADITDADYMRVIEEMQQEIRDAGAPPELVRGGVTPQDDGSWIAYAWQAADDTDWTWPT